MSKQTRAGFLKSLLGIAVAPAIISEVAASERNVTPSTPENIRKYPLTTDECYDGKRIGYRVDEAGQWQEPKEAHTSMLFWFERNPRWRVGDIGRTDMGCLFVVRSVEFHNNNLSKVTIMRASLNERFLYKNLIEGSDNIGQSYHRDSKEVSHE